MLRYQHGPDRAIRTTGALTVPQVVFIMDDSETNLARPKSATLMVL